MELLQTLRCIRACEGEAAAQLVLEAYVAQEVATEREKAAAKCDSASDELRGLLTNGVDIAMALAQVADDLAEQIRGQKGCCLTIKKGRRQSVAIANLALE